MQDHAIPIISFKLSCDMSGNIVVNFCEILAPSVKKALGRLQVFMTYRDEET